MFDLINDSGHVEVCNAIGGSDGDGRDLGEVAEPAAALVPTEGPEAEHGRGLLSVFCGGFNPADADGIAADTLDPEAVLIAAEEGRFEAAVIAVRGDPLVAGEWMLLPPPTTAEAEVRRAA